MQIGGTSHHLSIVVQAGWRRIQAAKLLLRSSTFHAASTRRAGPKSRRVPSHRPPFSYSQPLAAARQPVTSRPFPVGARVSCCHPTTTGHPKHSQTQLPIRFCRRFDPTAYGCSYITDVIARSLYQAFPFPPLFQLLQPCLRRARMFCRR